MYLTLKSADVCHSFWVPRLAGKTDLIPGRTNQMWFQTSQPGLFLGQCAEYCGTQHANMLLRVNVESPAGVSELAGQPAETGARTMRPPARAETCSWRSRASTATACAAPAPAGTYAPDLTHLMSRQTLASGMVPNTREELRKWLIDPAADQAGCLMPAFGLSEQTGRI